MNNKTLAAVGAFVVTLVLFSADSALAQGRGQDKDDKPKHAKTVKPPKPPKAKPAHDVKPKDAKEVKEAKDAKSRIALPRFGVRDRERITRYYGNLPPGLAKRNGNLPPGLQRQLQRNGVLPPGLRARVRPFPSELERQLSPLPPGYRRGIFDRHVVVYGADSYRIGDSIFDVLR